MVIFTSKQKKFEGDSKIKLCGKKLYPSESIEYLSVKIDTSLGWQYHVTDISIKLNRANALLLKMRGYVSLKILRSIKFTQKIIYLSANLHHHQFLIINCQEKCLILSIFLNVSYFEMPFMCNGLIKIFSGTNLDQFILDLYKRLKGMSIFLMKN